MTSRRQLYQNSRVAISASTISASAAADITALYSMAQRLKQGIQHIEASGVVLRLLGDADIALTKQVIPKIALAAKKAGETS